jgi:hypothetical protein
MPYARMDVLLPNPVADLGWPTPIEAAVHIAA